MFDNEQYKKHKIFDELLVYKEFYKDLSFGVFSYISIGTKAIFYIDTYIYSSIEGTFDSIYQLLSLGRINDAYALLRKLYDAIIVNIYCDLYLEDKFGIDNIIVDKINNWFIGNKKLPEYAKMNRYIKSHKKLEPLNKIIDFDGRYKKIRENCNNHVHYNSFEIMLSNDNEVINKNRIKLLDQLSSDVLNVVILHIACIILIDQHYIMASDYIDSLELGMTPEEGSQYLVAPYVQNMLNVTIKKYRKDIEKVIKENTDMEIE